MEAVITQVYKEIDETESAMAGKELGEEIERLREKAGWSQKELAQIIGLHQSRVSKMEKGEHNFPLETVYRLALAFNISPFELAAIYWGIEVAQLQNHDKEFLDNLLKLFDNYRKEESSKPLLPPLPTNHHAADEQTGLGIKEAKAINKKRNAPKKQPIPKPDLENNV